MEDLPIARRSRDRRRQLHPLVVPGLVLAGVLWLVGVGAVLVVRHNRTAAPPTNGPYTAVLSRDDFELLVGLTADEVLRAVGRPDQTGSTGGLDYWTYYNRTRDPVTGRTDAIAVLHFSAAGVARAASF